MLNAAGLDRNLRLQPAVSVRSARAKRNQAMELSEVARPTSIASPSQLIALLRVKVGDDKRGMMFPGHIDYGINGSGEANVHAYLLRRPANLRREEEIV